MKTAKIVERPSQEVITSKIKEAKKKQLINNERYNPPKDGGLICPKTHYDL